jgi:hypothetical protein
MIARRKKKKKKIFLLCIKDQGSLLLSPLQKQGLDSLFNFVNSLPHVLIFQRKQIQLPQKIRRTGLL